MVNEELIAYIKAQSEHGASREEITSILKKEGGWSDDDVIGAFAMVGNVMKEKLDIGNSLKKEEIVTVKEHTNTKEKREEDDINISEEVKLQKINKKINPFKALGMLIIIAVLAVGGVFIYLAYVNLDKEQVNIEESFLKENILEQEINENLYGLIEKDGIYYIQGKLVLPDGIIEKPVKVMNTSASLKLFPISEEGLFEVPVLQDQVNIIAVVLPGKKFAFTKIMLPTDFEMGLPVTIDSQSSAIALVFLSPSLISEDLKIAEPILSVARENEMVVKFAKVLADKVVTIDNPLEDDEYIEAFGSAIKSVLDYLNLYNGEEMNG